MASINGQPEVPLRAIHRMDGHGNSGVFICYSDHLGKEKLIPFADQVYSYWDRDEDERRSLLNGMAEGHDSFHYAIVKTPVALEIAKLKPGETACNKEKFPDLVNAL